MTTIKCYLLIIHNKNYIPVFLLLCFLISSMAFIQPCYKIFCRMDWSRSWTKNVFQILQKPISTLKHHYYLLLLALFQMFLFEKDILNKDFCQIFLDFITVSFFKANTDVLGPVPSLSRVFSKIISARICTAAGKL